MLVCMQQLHNVEHAWSMIIYDGSILQCIEYVSDVFWPPSHILLPPGFAHVVSYQKSIIQSSFSSLFIFTKSFI